MSNTNFTDIELEEFKTQSDFEFTDTNSTSAIKSNIFILSRNFSSLIIYLLKIKALLIREKLAIIIPNTLNIGDNYVQIINGITYNIFRINEFNIEITNLTNDWITDNLIVQIKNDLGVIQYFTITTIDMKISIIFSNDLNMKHTVYIM